MAAKSRKQARRKINTGQFRLGDQRAREAGKRGAEAQPIEAKRRGGVNSQED